MPYPRLLSIKNVDTLNVTMIPHHVICTTHVAAAFFLYNFLGAGKAGVSYHKGDLVASRDDETATFVSR